MDVAAVSGRVGPRLRCERGREPPRRGDASDRLAHHDLLVGRVKRGRMARRQPPAGPGQARRSTGRPRCPVLRGRRRVRRRSPGRRHPDRREAQARIDGTPLAVDRLSERELVLEAGAEDGAAGAERGLHPLQERPLADRRRVAVESELVGEHGGGAGRVRENAERLRVGDDPQLPPAPSPRRAAAWSSEFMASMASVTPIPLSMRASRPASAVAFARTVPVVSAPGGTAPAWRPSCSAALMTSAASTAET